MSHQHYGKCGNCGEKGHYNRNCPYERGICHLCKRKGHSKNECPRGKIIKIIQGITNNNNNPYADILGFCKRHPEWNWIGTNNGKTYENWPMAMNDAMKREINETVNTFDTIMSLDDIIIQTIELYNTINQKQDGKYSNWINLISRINYLKLRI